MSQKPLPLRLLEVMDVAVKVINFIYAKAKITGFSNSGWQPVANDMRAEHVGLLILTDVRRQFRGK